MDSLSEENIDKTIYKPVFLVLDPSALPNTAITTALLEKIASTAVNDFVLIGGESATDSGKGGKASTKAKGKGKEEAPASIEPTADVTITEGTGQAIMEQVAKEISTRQDALYAKRKSERQVREAEYQALVNVRNPAPTSVKGGKAPPKGKGKEKERKQSTLAPSEVVADSDESLPPPPVAALYPATLPLHVILTGVLKKPKDAEALLMQGVAVHGVIRIKPFEDPNLRDTTDEVNEFTYGVPLSPAPTARGIMTSRSMRTAQSQRSRSRSPRAFSPHLADELEPHVVAAKQAREVADFLMQARDTNPIFRDMGEVAVYLPDFDVMEAMAQATRPGTAISGADVSSPPPTAGKKGSKKGAKPPAKGAKGGAEPAIDEAQAKLIEGLATDVEINGRLFSQRKTAYEAWLADVPVREYPGAVAADAVDRRLYDNLLAQIPGAPDLSSMLYAMFEQVAVTVTGEDLTQTFAQQKSDSLEAYLDSTLAEALALDCLEDDDEEEDDMMEPEELGGPCVYKDGMCTACGEPEWPDDLDVGNNVGQAEAWVADELDTYTMGRGPNMHLTIRGGGGSDEMQDDEVGDQRFCPATMGEPCRYRDGRCEDCGEEQLLDYAGVEGEGGIEGGEGNVDFCPATMGEVCQYRNGTCEMCGKEQSMVYVIGEGEGDDTQRTGEASEQDEAETWYNDTEKFCPATMGEPCRFEDGMCIDCGEVQPGANEDQPGAGEERAVTRRRTPIYTAGSVAVECPATMGGYCQWGPDGRCSMCGTEKPLGARESKVCPATLGPKRDMEGSVPTVILSAGDERRLREARNCLALNVGWSVPALSDETNLLGGNLMLPGVRRVGMPTTVTKSDADRGIQRTELLNRSTLPADVFEKALLTLSFDEMLDEPGPSAKFTQQTHTQFFHVDHLYRKNVILEKALKQRLAVLRAQFHAAKTRSSSPRASPEAQEQGSASLVKFDETIGIGQDDEEVETARIPWNWELGKREYREEFAADVMPQVLLDAMRDPTDTTHCQARYEPLDDSMMVMVHVRTPLLRHRVVTWSDFLCPNLRLEEWAKAEESVTTTKPTEIFNFPNGHLGKLEHRAEVMYPRDGARLSSVVTKSGGKKHVKVSLCKDDYLVYMQKRPTHALVDGVDASARSHAITAYFKEGATLCVSRGAPEEDGENATAAELVYTQANGLIVTVTAQGNVYMSYPKPRVPIVAKVVADAAEEPVVTTIEESEESQEPVVEGKTGEGKAEAMEGTGAEGVKKDDNRAEGEAAPTEDDAIMSALGTSAELWRCVRPNGTVLRRLVDGSTQCLLPNANIATKGAEANACWVTTNNNGDQMRLETNGDSTHLGSQQIFTQTDPETGAFVMTREDLAMCITYSDGSMLAQHADGTRQYTDRFTEKGKGRYEVECPSLAPVAIDEKVSTKLDDGKAKTSSKMAAQGGGTVQTVESTIVITLADGTVIQKLLPHGSATVTRPNGTRFLLCLEGKVVLVPNTVAADEVPVKLLAGEYEAREIPKEVYTLDYMTGKVTTMDLEDNVYAADLAGKVTCSLSRYEGLELDNRLDAKYFPPPDNATQPRAFVVRGDGSGFELLSPDAVTEFFHGVENNPRIRALPAEDLDGLTLASPADEPIEGMLGRERSLKFLEKLASAPAYRRVPVLPKVLKATPAGLRTEQDSEAARFVVYRQLVQVAALTEEELLQAAVDRAEYVEWTRGRKVADADFEVEDARSFEEREEEERLQLELSTARARRKESTMRSTRDMGEVVAKREARLPSGVVNGAQDFSNTGRPGMVSTPQPIKPPGTSAAFSSVDGQGMQETKTFFANKGTKPVAKDMKGASQQIFDEAISMDPTFGTFFESSSLEQKFGIGALLDEVSLLCHPLHEPGMHANDLRGLLKQRPSAETHEAAEQHRSQLAQCMESLSTLGRTVGRIFLRPHDPTLRTVDLRREPYSNVLDAAPAVVANVAPTLMRCLGFDLQDEGADGGVLVQRKSDVHVKDGLRELVALLRLLADSIVPSEAGEGQAEGERPASSQNAGDDSDEEEDRFNEQRDEIEDINYGAGLTREDVEVQHKSHGQSFKLGSASQSQRLRTGDTVKSGGNYGEPNEEYVRREASSRQGVHTSSTARQSELDGASSKFAHWNIDPEHVDFGVVRLGCTYRITVALLNVSNTTGRLRVESKVLNDDPQSVLSIMQRPGEVAPGMTKRLEVQFYAGDIGAVRGELTVVTEQHTYRLPVSASVATGEMAPPGGMLPPLQKPNFSKTEGKFGPIGQCRLISEVPTSSTQTLIENLKKNRSRPLSGAISRPPTGSRPPSGRLRPLNSSREAIY